LCLSTHAKETCRRRKREATLAAGQLEMFEEEQGGMLYASE